MDSSNTQAYAINDDGSAKDPMAFKEALLKDPAKMEALKEEPEVLEIVQGDDMQAFQELLKSVYQVRCCPLTASEWSRVLADQRVPWMSVALLKETFIYCFRRRKREWREQARGWPRGPLTLRGSQRQCQEIRCSCMSS